MKRVAFALAFVLALSPLAASAQNETVTVTAESLIGPWRISLPLWHGIQRNLSVNYGPMRDAYCRVEGKRDDLHVYCLDARTPFKIDEGDEGDMSLQGDAIHICWCDFLFGVVIDATQKTPGIFTGSLSGKVMGTTSRAPKELAASKIVVSDSTPDAGGKSAVLAKLLAGIADGAPLSSLAQLPAKFHAEPPTAGQLRRLGAIQLIAYLGHTATPEELAAAGMTRLPDDRTALMQVYDVEFANGERVCEISTREDGVVNGLVCA